MRSPRRSARSARLFGAPDIVFAGKQTIDGDTAQVGPGVAKRLDLLQLTYVAEDRRTAIRRGAHDRSSSAAPKAACRSCKTRLPCLITMLEGSNVVRRGAIEDALRAARAEIVTWSAKDAGIEDIAKCGLRGSPTVVKRVFAPPPRAEKAILIELGRDGAAGRRSA